MKEGDDALAVFAAELRSLRSYARNPPLKEIVRQARKQRPPVSLSPSTLSDWFNGRSAPDPNPPIRFLLQFLRGRAVAAGHSDLPGLASYERLRAAAAAQTHAARGGRPARSERREPRSNRADLAGAVRVREADPIHLGVHRPIRMPGSDLDSLPPYVPRDVDLDDDNGVRARIRAASRAGGFVLVVGGSSVGKSRCLYEAVRELLPDWWLLQPTAPADLTAVAANPPGQLLVWLDDLQNHLDGDRGLTAATMRLLLRRRIVVVGTLWPGHHATFTAPVLSAEPGQDRHRHERELLKLADVVRLSGEFSLSERWRARKLADETAEAGDPRLRTVLKNARFGSREAADATSRRRAGRERRARPSARRKTGAQVPAGGSDESGLIFKLRDFGLNATQLRAIRMFRDLVDERAGLATSDGTRFGFTQTIAAAPQLIERWNNADPDELSYARAVLAAAVDAARLGVRAPLSADLLREAAPGYCTPAQRAHAPAGWFDLAMEYATRRLLGATAALVAVSATMTGEGGTHYRVADYLLQHVAAERSRTCPPGSFWDACSRHLTDAADLGDVGYAAVDRLRFRHAIPLLRRAAEEGDLRGLPWLTMILKRQNRADDLIDLLHACRAREGRLDIGTAQQLAELLVERGRTDEALDELRRQAAESPDGLGSMLLADLLAKIGAVDELRSRATTGDPHAAVKLAGKLLEQVDGLAAETGLEALHELARRLEEPDLPPGELEKLRDEVDRQDTLLRQRDALIQEVDGLLGDSRSSAPSIEDLERRAESGDSPAAAALARRLDEQGELDRARDILRAHLGSGDRDVCWHLAEVLIKQDQHDEAFDILRVRADAGDHHTTIYLSELLAQHGRTDEALELLRAREAAGDSAVFIWLDYLLARQGDFQELLDRALAGDGIAIERLGYVAADLLVEQGRPDDAFDVLREVADAGNRDMAMGELTEWLTRHGMTDEAERLGRLGLSADGFIETDAGD